MRSDRRRRGALAPVALRDGTVTCAYCGETAITVGVVRLWVVPDSTWLATSIMNKTVQIWDPATGQKTATLTEQTSG